MSDSRRAALIRFRQAGIAIVLALGGLASIRSPAWTAESFPIVSGTSEVSFLSAGLGPQSVTRALGRSHIVSHWSVADSTHWRIDEQVTEPVLQSHQETIVANGTSLIRYSDLYNRALELSQPSLGLFGLLLGGSMVGEIEAGGASSLSQAGGGQASVRQTGETTILGRQADIYEVAPLYSGTDSYGRAAIWIDHEFPLVLRMELTGLRPAERDPDGWEYQVTSLQIGQGPSPEALAYRPPVAVDPAPSSSASSGSGEAGLNARWEVPARFIPVGTPSGYVLRGAGAEDDPMADGTSRIEALFRHEGTFIYVEEQVRHGPLPASLRSHPAVQAGKCKVQFGRYAKEKLNWVALKRRGIALLAASNSLTHSELEQFVATKICG